MSFIIWYIVMEQNRVLKNENWTMKENKVMQFKSHSEMKKKKQ